MYIHISISLYLSRVDSLSSSPFLSVVQARWKSIVCGRPVVSFLTTRVRYEVILGFISELASCEPGKVLSLLDPALWHRAQHGYHSPVLLRMKSARLCTDRSARNFVVSFPPFFSRNAVRRARLHSQSSACKLRADPSTPAHFGNLSALNRMKETIVYRSYSRSLKNCQYSSKAS